MAALLLASPNSLLPGNPASTRAPADRPQSGLMRSLKLSSLGQPACATQRTGRQSSTAPHVAQIPARLEEQPALRAAAVGRRLQRRRPCGPVQAAAGGASASPSSTSSASASSSSGQQRNVLLWLKHDLRLDDHPGWHQALAEAAQAGSSVVPLFCFDPARYAHLVLPPGGAEALCRALAALDSALRRHGSGLVVRVGRWEEQLPVLAAELGAGSMLAEQEVEAAWCEGVAGVASALPPGLAIRHWSAPLLASHADDFRELKKQAPAVNAPLPAPAELPALPPAAAAAASGEPGPAASAQQLQPGELRRRAAEAYAKELAPAVATLGYETGAVGAAPAGSGSLGGSFSEEEAASAGPGSSSKIIDRLPVPDGSAAGLASGSGGGKAAGGAASWEAEMASEIAAGEGPVLEALGLYLRHLETTGDSGRSKGNGSNNRSAASSDSSSSGGDEAAERARQAALAEAIAAFDLPATPDGCFPALFGRALALGVVSKRRIFAEASSILSQQPEQERPGANNPLALLGWLLTSSGGSIARTRRQRKAAAAAAAAEAKDFHEQMAAGREGRQAHGATLHHWRWRGLLTDYLSASPSSSSGASGVSSASASDSSSDSKPAILLVHGFGAFSEHYRDNVAALAAAGYEVFAPTLPGYGRAEKPVLRYGQDVWRDFLADFVLQVVRRPVVVAGNSIGGFISASLAADYPGLVQGLVLLNSAGRILEGYQPPAEQPQARPPPPFVVDAVSRGLFSFLEGDVARQLRRVYPVRPDRADEWLGGEIARAARDPGALGVFRSVFYLPPPRALNYLVTEKFGGPTLVLQGVKDPLNNATQRVRELARFCPNAQAVELDAGHCPHDEVPETVNSHLLKFIEGSVLPSQQKKQQGQAAGAAAAQGSLAGTAAKP